MLYAPNELASIKAFKKQTQSFRFSS